MQLTPLGKWLRHRRIERGVMLGDMATALNVSAPTLSSIEHGRRKPTIELGENIRIFFQLNEGETNSLFELISQEIDAFTMTPANDVEKEAMLLFARYVSSFKQSDLDRIKLAILGENEGGKDARKTH